MKKHYCTWDESNKHLSSIIREMALENWVPDVIIGPGRGGYIAGVMLSHYFNVPFEGFNWQTRDGSSKDLSSLLNILSKYSDVSNILVVDDINDSGLTLEGISEVINKNSLISNIKYATIFEKSSSSFACDWCALELGEDDINWIVFPYEEWWK